MARPVSAPRHLLVAALLLCALAACGPKSGAPGDGRSHSVDPSGNHVIESGEPDMPVDP
ncbi:hypothetical protein [Streptomyces sp. NPDC046371]|uniref:hypothetical protein n=1 Tax=Streptomyces sp. NPDC046371 TaxID=3154916 RepID=UPI00340E148F